MSTIVPPTPDTQDGEAPKATCPTCGASLVLRKDETFRLHRRADDSSRGCPMSHRPRPEAA